MQLPIIFNIIKINIFLVDINDIALFAVLGNKRHQLVEDVAFANTSMPDKHFHELLVDKWLYPRDIRLP
jgi:hypothetical protein